MSFRNPVRLLLTLLAIISLLAPAVATASGPSLQGRALADRPDQVGALQVHAIYFVPRDGADRALDRNGFLDGAVRHGQAWLARQTGGRLWRTDTYDRRRLLDVTFVRGQDVNSDYLSNASGLPFRLQQELSDRGFDQARTNKRYLVFYDGLATGIGLCGTSQYPVYGPRQYTPAADPGPKIGGAVAVAFLRSDPACHAADVGTDAAPGWLPTTIMHELTHLEGLVAPGAVHACSPVVFLNAHVCGVPTTANVQGTEPFDPERNDLLYPLINLPLKDKALDTDHLDYYRSPALLDLTGSAFLVEQDQVAGERPSRDFSALPPQLPTQVVPHIDGAGDRR